MRLKLIGWIKIGRVFETLRQHEIEDNTLVMFLSDNGGCAEYLEEDGWARFYSKKLRRPTGGFGQSAGLAAGRP